MRSRHLILSSFALLPVFAVTTPALALNPGVQAAGYCHTHFGPVACSPGGLAICEGFDGHFCLAPPPVRAERVELEGPASKAKKGEKLQFKPQDDAK